MIDEILREHKELVQKRAKWQFDLSRIGDAPINPTTLKVRADIVVTALEGFVDYMIGDDNSIIWKEIGIELIVIHPAVWKGRECGWEWTSKL